MARFYTDTFENASTWCTIKILKGLPLLRMFARIILWSLLSCPAWAGWQAVGPFGGAAAVVAVDPHHPDTVLAATSNALLFRSTDAGGHWSALPFSPQLRSVLHAFALDPRQADTYFAAISGDSPEYSGLFRTRDAGSSWDALPGLRGKEVWSIALWPADSKVIAAGTRGGVYLTRDGGDSWLRISSPSNADMEVVVSLAFDPNDSNVLYAGTPHLPWKTTDGGLSWRSAHAGMLDDSDVFSIQVDATRPMQVFASACSGIYNSQNGGASWTKLTGARGASYRTYFVAEDPREPGVVFAGTTHGLVKSGDGGKTWRQLSVHVTRWVAFDSLHPRRIFVATDDAGILRSDDEGETLAAVNEGFCNRHLPSLAVAGGALFTNTIYDPSSGGVFRLPAGGGAWEQTAPASRLLGQQVLALATDGANPARLYAAGFSALITSPDAGKSWTPLPGVFGSARVTALLGPDTGAEYMLAATDRGLFRSVDGGRLWQTSELPSPLPPLRRLVRLGAARAAAVTASGIFLTEDGLRWRAAASLPGGAVVHDLALAGDALLAATSAGLLRSDDAGATWAQVSGGLDPGTIRALAVHPTRSGVLFAAQYGDVYTSQDSGRSWAKISPQKSGISIQQLAVLPGRADLLFALTRSQGVFALPLETLASGVSGSRGTSSGAERGVNDK
jgi:photosystem II stability/assembly factor-like uncharacterized protein